MNLGRVGVILPGGGLRCAIQVGFLEYIDKVGIKIEKILCASGGAFNGAGYVESGSNALKMFWSKIDEIGYRYVFSGSGFVKLWHAARGNNAFCSDKGLWRLVNNLNMSKIINSPISLEIAVFNETTEEIEIVGNHEFKDDPAQHKLLRQFIKASASYSGIFPPEEIHAQTYSDPCGISARSLSDMDTIFLVETGQPRQTVNPAKLNAVQRLIKKNSFMTDRQIESNLKENFGGKFRVFPEDVKWAKENHSPFLRRIWELFKDGPVEKRLVLTDSSMNIDTLSLGYGEKGDILKSIKHGYERTEEILATLES
ncbi:MAG: hypothetical protein HYT03_02420 [Candidatus Harrisonbacteria bacterium]|nr:hypothetical protein [Candidatus Harrisonbacteria bacterium]